MTRHSRPSSADGKIEILIDQVGRLTEVLITGLQDSRDLINASFQQMRQDMRDEFREMRTDPGRN